MKTKKILFSLSIILLTPFITHAAIVQNSAEINLGAEQNFSENTYLIASKNSVTSVFEKDIFLMGFENKFDGKVTDDLFVIGGKNEVNGQVNGDLRVIGGDVVLNGKISGDLLVFGGNVVIGPNAIIEGQSVFVGGKVYQGAPLNKSAKIIAGSVNLNSEVKEPIEITAQKIIAEPNSKIDSFVQYYSPKQIEQQTGSQINGEVSYNQIEKFTNSGIIKRTLINLLNFWILLKFITTLIVAFVMVFVFRVFTQKSVDLGIKSYGKSLVTGLLFSIMAPFFITILIISLVGLPIGVLMLLVYFLLWAVSVALGGIILGAILRKVFFKQPVFKADFNSAAIGIILLTFIGFVPVIGNLARLIFDLVSVGAIIRQIKINLFG